MKRANTFFIIVLLAIMTGCGENKQSTDDLITIDVTGNYPKKELILQDFLDVEYIPLETNDDFVSIGFIQDIGKEIILDRSVAPGPASGIFLFDRSGKSIRMIDKRGQGPGEYVWIANRVLLDEDNNEIFVITISPGQIFVYDLFGNFKRTLPMLEGQRHFVDIKNFDHDHLICYYNTFFNALAYPDQEQLKNSFWIISKQDGSVTKEIEIPYKQRKIIHVYRTIPPYQVGISGLRYLTPYHDSWVLLEPSSDTVYRYLPDHSIIPFIARTPSIQSMDPEIFLVPGLLTDRYYFMQFIVKRVDNGEFPTTDMMYDRQEKTLFEAVVHNDDFTYKRPVHTWQEFTVTTMINGEELVYAEKLEAYELVEAYKNGQLKGKLNEIAAGMDEEDNPVIMIAKNKK